MLPFGLVALAKIMLKHMTYCRVFFFLPRKITYTNRMQGYVKQHTHTGRLPPDPSQPNVHVVTCVINALKMLLNLVVSTVGTIISKYDAVGS